MNMVLVDVTPVGLVNRYRSFDSTFCLQLQVNRNWIHLS